MADQETHANHAHMHGAGCDPIQAEVARRSTSLILLRASAIAWLSALPACQGPPPNPSASGTTSTTEASALPVVSSITEAPASAAPIPDAALATAIEGAFSRDPVLHALAVRVSVLNGEVTLRGEVPTLAVDRRARQIVGSFKGATALLDGLVAGGPARPDAEIAKSANAAIKRDPATRKSSVQATASGGTVTLRGTVDSAAQREVLVEDVARVPGARAVVLALASATSPRSDKEISSDVTGRFRDDARLDGAELTVDLRNGSVFVSGVVGSVAQWNDAIEDAWVSGVTDVDAHAVRVDWRASDRARASAAVPLSADSHVVDLVRQRLLDDPVIGAQVPAVSIDNGVATLSGRVVDFRARRAAVRDADGVRGVNRVDDLLTVAPAVPESDAVIEDAVQRTLYNDPSTPDARNLQITTANGRVTLSGAVSSPEEKTVIEGDVEEVAGVVAVEDDLQVKGYDSATHAIALGSICDRVREAIFWDTRVGAGEVATDATPSGDVTLTGLVHTAGEARAASEDAFHAGAAHVVNHIHLAGAPGFSLAVEPGR